VSCDAAAGDAGCVSSGELAPDSRQPSQPAEPGAMCTGEIGVLGHSPSTSLPGTSGLTLPAVLSADPSDDLVVGALQEQASVSEYILYDCL